MANCEVACSPSGSIDSATPQGVCRWITQAASGRAACTAPWMVKPVGLMLAPEPSTTRPDTSTFTSELAVISSKRAPKGLIR